MPADFALPARPIALSLIGGRAHYASVVQAVLDAKVSVWIATANLKELLVEGPRRPGQRRRGWRSVLAVFDELAVRGVELRILHAGFPSTPFRAAFDRHPRLVRGGLELRQCARVHLKTVIVDGRWLYLGSANWTGAGLGGKADRNRNFEIGIWTEDEPLLDHMQELFDHLWSGGECRGCGRRNVCDAPIDELPPRKR